MSRATRLAPSLIAAAILALGTVPANAAPAAAEAPVTAAPAAKAAKAATYKWVGAKVKNGVFSAKLVKGNAVQKGKKIGLGAIDAKYKTLSASKKTNNAGVVSWKVPNLKNQIVISAGYQLSKKNIVTVGMCSSASGKWSVCPV